MDQPPPSGLIEVPAPEPLPEPGRSTRWPNWLAPTIGALVVLVVGLPWLFDGVEAFLPPPIGRWLIVLGGMGVVAGLLSWFQIRLTPSVERLDAAERSLRLLSEALIQAKRELEDRRQSERELRIADRSKDDFLATLCHELRNPLAAIDHAGELLIASDDDPEQRAWAVRIIRNQARLLARLVDDLLDVTRIASGALTLNRRPTSLSELVRSAVDAGRAFLEETGQAVHLDFDDAPLMVDVDPARIHQVLINLLSNACRYSDPGRTITVSSFAEGDEAVLRVADEGMGIDPELLPRVFDMFVRGDHARDRSPTGLGLGLRLVKLIVERHGGTISAESKGLGEGSVFEFRLPRVSPAIPDEESRTHGGRATPRRSYRLLLVDDNRAMVEALQVLLKRDGHEVHLAGSGEEAIEAVIDARPDLILLDLELPDRDGIEVARLIQQTPGAAPPTIIALTGSSRPPNLDQLHQLGIRSLVQKPVQIEQLREMLDRTFRDLAGIP